MMPSSAPMLSDPPATPSRPRLDTAASSEQPSEVRRGLPGLRSLLYARALKLSRSPSQADDLVQDTMVRALRFEHQYRPGTNLRAWLSQVLTSVFLTQCRQLKRRRLAFDRLLQDPSACKRVTPAPVMASLSASPARALGSLPAGYRAAVELVDIGGLSYREAADKLQVPIGTVMSRIHRGRKLLAQMLVEPASAPGFASTMAA